MISVKRLAQPKKKTADAVFKLTPLVKTNMNNTGRLTLAELKAQKSVVVKIEAIKGGNSSDCHLDSNAGFWDTVYWVVKTNWNLLH